MHSSSSQKTNIRVSTDMQSTNYTIKKHIQNTATDQTLQLSYKSIQT